MRKLGALVITAILVVVFALPVFGTGNHKVTICHIPPGNPANAHTIEVSKNALKAHLKHGDYLGECIIVEEPTTTTVVEEESTTTIVEEESTTTTVVEDTTTTIIEEPTTTIEEEDTTTTIIVVTPLPPIIEDEPTPPTVVVEDDEPEIVVPTTIVEKPVVLPFTGIEDYLIPLAIALTLAGAITLYSVKSRIEE
jgi:hypothetical protein